MWTEERLNKMLTTPSEALSGELGRLEGDILVLGAGGKMGPTLCVLAKNALRAGREWKSESSRCRASATRWWWSCCGRTGWR